MRSLLSLVSALAITIILVGFVTVSGNFILYGSPLPPKAEVKVIVAEAGAAPAAKADAKPFDKATYVAVAANGEKIVAKCKACHSLGNGEPNKTGPNLFGIIDRAVTAHEGFAYSDAMKGKAAELGTWSEDNLFTYLESPKKLVPGTKMAFAGIADPAQRMDLIAYLKTLK